MAKVFQFLIIIIKLIAELVLGPGGGFIEETPLIKPDPIQDEWVIELPFVPAE